MFTRSGRLSDLARKNMPINTAQGKKFRFIRCLAIGARRAYLAPHVGISCGIPYWHLMAKLGTFALIVALLAILVASAWLAVRTWIATSASQMSASGYVAMALGIVLSLVVGCGLMALVFYSSRYGYDDEAYDPVQHRDGDRD